MERFLDSAAFEQMAREYNLKYSNNVSTLNDESVDFEEVKRVFDNVYEVFSLIKKAFGKNSKFFGITKDIEKFKSDTLEFFKKRFNKDYFTKENKPPLFVNYKMFANAFMAALMGFENKLEKINNEQIKNELIAFKKDYINLINDFYKLV